MTSHSSTNSYLRSSVYDAALDLGLADPKLAMWLEEIPESPVADVKSNTNYPTYGGPTSSSSHAMGLSSPESDFSHSSNTTVITSPSLSSHDGTPFYTFAQASGSHKGPPRGRFDRPELESFLRTEVVVTKSPPPPPQQPTSSMAPPPTKASKKAAKLLKKQRPSDPTKSAKSSIDRERPSRDKNTGEDFDMDSRDRFAFLKDEPVNLAQDKESRSFFGRLRDRSRSKSRVGKEDKRGGDVSARASDEAMQTPTETRGRTVTVTVKGGAPQLQLEPRNRDSADLLSSMNFGVSTASSPPNTFFVSQPQPLPTPTYIEPASPPPHVGPVMDRPHPKVRTSGYWGNKDRGTVVPTARATTFRAGGGSMARRGSHHRKGSSSRGLRKVPSGRRPRPAAGTRASRLSTASTLTLHVVHEPDVADVVSEDIDPIVEAIDKYRGMSFMSTPSTPGMSEEPQAKTPEQATPIPVIIERKPSTKSTNRSIPPLSLKIDPRLMGVSRPLASPLRSPSSARSQRHSRHSNLPSPLKPPTSPLPPTPTLSPPPNRTGNRTLRPPSTQPANSDWFDDDGSSDNRSVTPMSPLFPREDYVVASPGASAGTFPVTSPNVAVASVGSSRPSAGRTALTPEGRARTLSVIGPSARASQLRPGVESRRTAEQGIPSSPKPTATIPPSASAKAVVPPRLTALRRSPSSSPSLKPPPIMLGPKFPTPSSSPKPLWRSPSSPSLSATGPSAMAPQRGRTSPFPTRPIGALSRSPSVVSLQQSDSGRSVKVEETKVDVDVRRKELAVELSPTSGLLKRKESISELPRAMQVERYGNMPLRAFLPAAGKNFESKEIVVPRTNPRSIAGPSKADLPLMPRMASLRQQSSSKPPPSSQPPPKPPRSIARPPPSVNVIRASVASDVATAPKPLIRQESLPATQSRDSVWTRATQSVYSTVDGSGSDTEDEADDRFGLELDEEDADDDSLRGFDVIAAKFGKGRSSSKSPSRQNRLLQAIRNDDDDQPKRAKPSSPSPQSRSQDLLAVPPSPVDLPPASPSRPRATAGAGGSRWI